MYSKRGAAWMTGGYVNALTVWLECDSVSHEMTTSAFVSLSQKQKASPSTRPPQPAALCGSCL